MCIYLYVCLYIYLRVCLRLSFSLGAFPAAEGPLVWVLLDFFLDGDISVGVRYHGFSSVRRKITWRCPSGSRVPYFAPERSVSWLTWLVRLDPYQSSELLAYMYLDCLTRV